MSYESGPMIPFCFFLFVFCKGLGCKLNIIHMLEKNTHSQMKVREMKLLANLKCLNL